MQMVCMGVYQHISTQMFPNLWLLWVQHGQSLQCCQ